MTAQVSALVKEAADVDPIFMSPADKTAALAELTLLQDQLRLIELGVARTCGDLAAQAGHRAVAGRHVGLRYAHHSWQQFPVLGVLSQTGTSEVYPD
jgi:hypothetical protein